MFGYDSLLIVHPVVSQRKLSSYGRRWTREGQTLFDVAHHMKHLEKREFFRVIFHPTIPEVSSTLLFI